MGGLANHAEEFAQAFSSVGSHVTVFAPRLPGYAEHNSGFDIRIVYYPAREIIPNFPVPAFWRPAFWRAWRSLKDRRYTCVFSRTRFFPISLLALLFAKQAKTPWIHVEHGSAFVKVGNPLVNIFARLYDETLGRLVLTSSNAVVAISRAVQQFVRRWRHGDVPVIYRGLNLSAYDRVAAEPGLRPRYAGKTIVAWSGRMYRWKGVHLILEAIQRLPDHVRQLLQLVLIGDGEDRRRLEDLAKGLPVTFTGALEREAVLSLLKSADIFVHASLPGGGLSTSLLEAMYCGNAVVASPYEGGDEIVVDRQNGLLVRQLAAPALAERIEQLISDSSLRQRLAVAARATVKQRFSWPAVVEQYTKVIESVARKT